MLLATRALAAAEGPFSVAGKPLVSLTAGMEFGATAASDRESLTDWIGRRARELPPTHPAFSLSFPVRFVRRLLWDSGALLTAPARWDRWNWGQAAIFAAATGGFMGLDREIDIQSRKRHPRGNTEKSIENALQDFGYAPGIAAVVGGGYLFGFLTGSDDAKNLATDAGEALILSGAVTGALKDMIGRERPNREEGPFRFHPFSGNASLPSGHATAAFALASSVAEHFSNSLWAAVPVYGLASAVALSRVRANAHFASDVLVGAAIGTAVGRTTSRLEQERLEQESQAGKVQVSLAPEVNSDFRGLAVSVRF